MKSLNLRSYAKINLALDILGKREDNYHELETVFQQIDLCDDVELTENEGDINIECNVKEIENESNLAYKAATIIKKRFNIKKGVSIRINKNIPIGAGLSGGSSNAAAVIRGLNYLWSLGLDKEKMIELSKEIGMDVPFHILGGTCFGKGRGDNLENVKDLGMHYAVVVHPGFKVNTKEAYDGLDLGKTGKKESSRKFIESYDLKDIHNDFEYSVLEKYPELEKIKRKLGEDALLSGSGSCVFGLFKDEEGAKLAYDELKKDYSAVFLSKTLNKRVELAKVMGFCFGVERAIEEIKKISEGKKVYVLGKLIHNPQVIEKLEKEGIMMIDDLEGIEEGTIVISAHGIPDKTIEEIKSKGLEVIDLTCPFVKKVHHITKDAEKKGRKIIVFGDEKHTEVKGIVGDLKDYKVIMDLKEMDKSDSECKLTLVSQTTRDVKEFEGIAKGIKEVNKDSEIKDTICSATKERQTSSIELAKKSDLMIVVGGKMSSNTIRLKEICSKFCETKHIETEEELRSEWLFNKKNIGITAGASTAYDNIHKVKSAIELIL